MVATAALLIVPLVCAAAIVFFLFRHWLLMALIMLAPLPGLFVYFAASLRWDFPSPNAAAYYFAYLFGVVAAGLIADEFVLARAGGESGHDALKSTRWRQLDVLAASGAVTAFTLSRFGAHIDFLWASVTEALAIGLSLLSVASVLQLAQFLPFDEEFIARTNRFRELAERMVDRLLPIAQPRWAFAFTGIALVLATTIAFRLDTAFLYDWLSTGALRWALFIGAMAACLIAVTQDWRTAVASLVTITVVVFPVFLIGFSVLSLQAPSLFGFCFLLVASVASQTARYARGGDEMGIATVRTLTRSTLGIGVLGAALWTAPLLYLTFNFFFIAISGVLGALVLLPAFAVTIETLFPHRETLEARYRVH